MAAASARQKSTSKPDQSPLSSLNEKPSSPWLTPQMSEPRSCTVLSVCCASAIDTPKPRAAAAVRSGMKKRMTSLES